MSDELITSAISGVLALCGTIFTGVMAYLLARLTKVAKDTHVLVNSNMGIQLEMHAGTARRLADETKKTKDVEAADLAERRYAEHQKSQAVADSNGITPLSG